MSLSVLIVDDHEPMRLVLRKMLERAGVEVRTAGGGAEALALLAERASHIVLSDQSMPGMTGMELAQELRASYPGVRMLILSGHADTTFAKAARDAGADAVLVKPILPRALLEAVARVMSSEAQPDARAAIRA